MQKTGIEYLDMTWNPIAMRCTPVSAGCDHCWHLHMANRLSKNPSMDDFERGSYAGGVPSLRTKELAAPIKRKKPARIGVHFMGDIFNGSIPNEWIAAVFGAMAAAPHHQFFVLTKRPKMAEYWFRWVLRQDETLDAPWPLPNVCLGVSVEDQKTAEERIPVLLQIPAAKRWVSYEPALGRVDLNDIVSFEGERDAGCGWEAHRIALYCDGGWNGATLDWVVAGAETGPGARPCNLDWIRSVRGQCASYGVPFFLKQINAAGDRALDGMIHSEMP